MAEWDKRHRLWLAKFSHRKDSPPGGWANYLGATWLPRAEWFPRYNLYLKSSAWRGKRAAVLRRAGNKCQLCPNTTRLEVHHVTYSHVGNEPAEDLRCLCHGCHKRLDDEGDKFIPMDHATRAHVRRKMELKERKQPAKKATRRIPAADVLASPRRLPSSRRAAP